MNTPLECSQCYTAVPATVVNQPELTPCPHCGALLQVDIFPAYFRPKTTGRDGEAVMMEGEASCFYHPQKKAIQPCEGCGRFLCGLCDCELHGQHFCPACLEKGRSKGKIQNLEAGRTRYDNIALGLATYPLLIFYFTIITAPIALFVAIRYWKAPQSIVRRTRTRLIVAIVIATLQIIAWAGSILYFTYLRSHD